MTTRNHAKRLDVALAKAAETVRVAQSGASMWGDQVRQAAEQRHGVGPGGPLPEDAEHDQAVNLYTRLRQIADELEAMRAAVESSTPDRM